ncbi:hypothetical protein E2C01_056857 [Portunus trituberculatus]|uniref:Uncharacterized protein n=1 Tax=Portunus trituberculatus TaxID=210409 RepID=A0A5B7H0A3_PORTR|nr:hypothetical protein [Portunus trituberculatus]
MSQEVLEFYKFPLPSPPSETSPRRHSNHQPMSHPHCLHPSTQLARDVEIVVLTANEAHIDTMRDTVCFRRPQM